MHVVVLYHILVHSLVCHILVHSAVYHIIVHSLVCHILVHNVVYHILIHSTLYHILVFGTLSKFQIYCTKNGLGYRAELPPRYCALVLLHEPDVNVLGLPEPLLLGLNVPRLMK